jgi:hypothetical protein
LKSNSKINLQQVLPAKEMNLKLGLFTCKSMKTKDLFIGIHLTHHQVVGSHSYLGKHLLLLVLLLEIQKIIGIDQDKMDHLIEKEQSLRKDHPGL